MRERGREGEGEREGGREGGREGKNNDREFHGLLYIVHCTYMYMYIHCTCTCMYIYTCTCTFIHVHVHVHLMHERVMYGLWACEDELTLTMLARCLSSLGRKLWTDSLVPCSTKSGRYVDEWLERERGRGERKRAWKEREKQI